MTTSPTLLEELGLADGGQFALGHVPMSQSEAEAHVRTHWHITGSATRLATEKDDSFLVRADDGRRFVVKFSNPLESRDQVDFEVSVTQHAAEFASGVTVPRYLTGDGGEPLVDILDGAGQRRLTRLMTHIAGTPLDSTGSNPSQRREIGAALAALRHATSTFDHPAARRLYVWDVRNLPGLQPLIATVADPGQRDMLEAGYARYLDIADAVAGMRSQVLHNDFSKSNIIVDHDSPRFVQGVIDFGDTAHTAIAVDVSTALLNQLPRVEMGRSAPVDLFADGRDLLAGYLEHADLTEEELAAIPHLVMARVVARALITLRRAALIPTNTDYIMRNTAQGWAQLRWFLDRTPEDVSTALL
jgi:hydroxylysine kinase